MMRVGQPVLLYLHILKNSGSTLKNVLKKNYKNIYSLRWGMRNERHHRNLLSKGESARWDGYDVLSGHFPFGMHRLLSPDRGYRYLALLRYPVVRSISAYHYLMNDSSYTKANPELRSFISKLGLVRFSMEFQSSLPNHVYADNGQVRYPSGIGDEKPFGSLGMADLEQAKANLSDMTFGLTEQFDRSMLYFKDQFGWSSILYAKKKVGRSRTRSAQDDADRQAIRAANHLDYELYEFGVDLFRQRTAYIDDRRMASYAVGLKAYQATNRILTWLLSVGMKLR